MFLKVLGTIVISASLAATAAAQAPQRPAAQIQQRILMLYISDFRNEVGLSDEQFTKVMPLLRRFIEGRFRNAANRQALTERLNAMLEGNPGEQEVELLNRQLLQVNNAKVNLERSFFTQIDPELTPVQRLKVRVFQENFEQWLLRRVELARSIVSEEQQQQQQQNRQNARPAPQGNPAGSR